MVANIVTAVVLIVYLVVAWFAGALIGVTGARLWALRIGLSVIGFAVAALFLWFEKKLKRDRLMRAPNAGFVGELEAYLAAASARIRQATGVALERAPIVYVIGDSNTAKTSIIQHCGLDPMLIAGEPEREGQIAATSTINVWLAGSVVFIEAGGMVSGDADLWTYLLERTQPNPLSLGGRPSRAIVVCSDCEHLSGPAEAVTASGQKMANRLREAAATLGACLPVYVLFTKLDRVTHFAEFVAGLSQMESSQTLGATLARAQAGVASEGHSQQEISYSLDQLMSSLAEKRVDYLMRETAAEKIPSIYEFPRELRKLRAQILEYLTALSKSSSQAGEASCFLRGFYFSGVRAVMVTEMVQIPKVSAAAAASVAAATRMFTVDEVNAMTESSSGPVMQQRRVPEWSFLPQLFDEVILRDQPARKVSAYSYNTDRVRAALLAFASAFLLVAAGLVGYSFLHNRALEQDALASGSALQSAPELPVGEIAGATQLIQLDRVRTMLLQLDRYQSDGHPLRLGFGLYAGGSINPDLKRIYFEGFRKLLLHPLQLSMLQQLGELPSTARAADEFGTPYKTLKTYLITTTEHDKATSDFLVPALVERWSAGKDVDEARLSLARMQFDYYAAQLATSNPLPSDADTATVQHAREYLSQFNGTERLYQGMLAEAARNNPDLNFNRRYVGSAQVVVDSHVVPGAFTRGGFAFMQDALNNPDKYYGAEEWVLGRASAINLPKDQLQQELRTRYATEYLNQWRAFLRAANVARYNSASDAANKLRVLSGNRSPLMLLFWTAASNTNVDLPGSAKAFDAVQRVASGATEDHPIGQGAQMYMTALNALQGAVSAVAAAPDALSDSGPMNSALVAAGSARSSVGQVAQGFLIDSEGHIDSQVRKLMEDPIVSAESLVRRLVQQQAEKQKQAVAASTSKQ